MKSRIRTLILTTLTLSKSAISTEAQTALQTNMLYDARDVCAASCTNMASSGTCSGTDASENGMFQPIGDAGAETLPQLRGPYTVSANGTTYTSKIYMPKISTISGGIPTNYAVKINITNKCTINLLYNPSSSTLRMVKADGTHDMEFTQGEAANNQGYYIMTATIDDIGEYYIYSTDVQSGFFYLEAIATEEAEVMMIKTDDKKLEFNTCNEPIVRIELYNSSDVCFKTYDYDGGDTNPKITNTTEINNARKIIAKTANKKKTWTL